MVLKQQIEVLIAKAIRKIELPMTPIRDVEKALEKFGYEMEDLDGNTNGWEVDFWYWFKAENKPRLCLSGSLHYGKFTLSISEEQDDD